MFSTEQEAAVSFIEKLRAKWREGKFLCVGLDSDLKHKKFPKRVPDHDFAEQHADKLDADGLKQLRFNCHVVDATKHVAAAYKPNLAFYKRDVGKRVLVLTIQYIRLVAPDAVVILDPKQGDIGNTNDGYVEDDFDYYGVDAVTVHNYMGMEAMRPFLDRVDKHPKKPGPLTDEVMNLIGVLFVEMIRGDGISFDCYADIPEAGAPFGDQIERVTMHRSKQPRRLYLHKEILPDGNRRITEQVDGSYELGEICLVVDEMITQADTKLEACRALVSNGLVVSDVLVLVDRMQGGRQQLRAAGYALHAVFELQELLDHYVELGLMPTEKAEAVMEYIRANQAA